MRDGIVVEGDVRRLPSGIVEARNIVDLNHLPRMCRWFGHSWIFLSVGWPREIGDRTVTRYRCRRCPARRLEFEAP